MAFTMACPNFKKGLKMVSGPLGVKPHKIRPSEGFTLRGPIVDAHGELIYILVPFEDG
jgi:hypothetical protein